MNTRLIFGLLAIAALPAIAIAQNAAPPAMDMPGMAAPVTNTVGTFKPPATPPDMHPSSVDFRKANDVMMKGMDVTMTGNSDRDFAAMMIAHHQGAIDMAKIELQYGKAPELKDLAQKIVAAQEAEIALMRNWQTMDQMDDHH